MHIAFSIRWEFRQPTAKWKPVFLLESKRTYAHILTWNLDVYLIAKGPSINDVHTEGGQAQVDACGRVGGVKPHVDVHTEN